jgi:hypothetical protein
VKTCQVQRQTEGDDPAARSSHLSLHAAGLDGMSAGNCTGTTREALKRERCGHSGEFTDPAAPSSSSSYRSHCQIKNTDFKIVLIVQNSIKMKLLR